MKARLYEKNYGLAGDTERISENASFAELSPSRHAFQGIIKELRFGNLKRRSYIFVKSSSKLFMFEKFAFHITKQNFALNSIHKIY